jgi:hypothetical protein
VKVELKYPRPDGRAGYTQGVDMTGLVSRAMMVGGGVFLSFSVT